MRILWKCCATFALAWPLLATAGGASFTESQVGDEVSFSGLSPHKGKFSDSFSFVVGTSPTDAVLDIDVLDIGKVGVKNLRVELFDGSTLINGDLAIDITPLGHHSRYVVLSDSFTGLGAGDYTVDILGRFKSGGGFFAGGITLASAVPEPGTWAAMLLGLVMMGYIAHRRSR